MTLHTFSEGINVDLAHYLAFKEKSPIHVIALFIVQTGQRKKSMSKEWFLTACSVLFSKDDYSDIHDLHKSLLY